MGFRLQLQEEKSGQIGGVQSLLSVERCGKHFYFFSYFEQVQNPCLTGGISVIYLPVISNRVGGIRWLGISRKV